MNNSFDLAVNIPADGIFIAVLNNANGDFSKENCTQILKNYIDKHLDAKPDIILLNVCYRRCLTPSNVFDSYLYDIETTSSGELIKRKSPVTDKVSKYFSSFFSCGRVLLENGIDVYKILSEYIREKGTKVYFSIRMNDGHYTNNPAVNSSFALRDNGKYTINHDGAMLDFSQKPVRDYYYKYVLELLENYHIDGIELDWLRYPDVLPAEKRFDFGILNGYMQEIRSLLNDYNNELGLAVRVLSDEHKNLDKGYDVCQWIAKGIVDIVTIENFYIPTNFEMPVFEWKTQIKKRNTMNNPYKLYCGSDWAVSCIAEYNIPMNPALVRGFVNECISSGADGIYLFNFFEENDTSSFELVDNRTEKPYLKNCFSQRIKAAKEPCALPRRCVHIGSSDKRYPIVLKPFGCYTFKHIPKKPFNNFKIVVGTDTDDILLVSNDGFCSKIALKNEEIYEGYEYIPETEINQKSHFIYAISQAAKFVKSEYLPLPIKKNDFYEITIQNASDKTVRILWIELCFE